MKRVVVYRFDRAAAEALVDPATFLQPAGMEFLSASGTVYRSPYPEIKAVCFAPESGPYDLFGRSNLFERRPKCPGLWTRFTMRDGERLDGMLSHNLLDWPEPGWMITPPKASGSRQRVFLPRPAVAATELRGVVGAGAGSRVAQSTAPASKTSDIQLWMFD